MIRLSLPASWTVYAAAGEGKGFRKPLTVNRPFTEQAVGGDRFRFRKREIANDLEDNGLAALTLNVDRHSDFVAGVNSRSVAKPGAGVMLAPAGLAS